MIYINDILFFYKTYNSHIKKRNYTKKGKNRIKSKLTYKRTMCPLRWLKDFLVNRVCSSSI